jgi:ADP-ribose pyrophosphatase YjhB (NUDIX family)
MKRVIRYQAAIIRDKEILLIRHQEHNGNTYWLLPGGGIEDGETAFECVKREVFEETHLKVSVRHLLYTVASPANDATYQRFNTYLCHPIAGEAQPGFEPELEASTSYSIAEVGWFNLFNEAEWGNIILNDSITYKQLLLIRNALE